MLRLDANEKLKLEKQESIVLNSTLTSPKMIIVVATKVFVDLSSEKDRSRRDMSKVFNDPDKEFDDEKRTNLNSITLNRNPSTDTEHSKEKYVYDSLEVTILRFKQTLEKLFKHTVGNSFYNLREKNTEQTIDTTGIKHPNQGGYLLQQWKIKCKDEELRYW